MQTNHKQQAMLPDSEIIRQILDGATGLFRLLVNRHANEVMRIVGRIVPVQADAEDVMQEAFVAAYQQLTEYDVWQAGFRTWLLGIACHKALKQAKNASLFPHETIDREKMENLPDADVDHLLDDTLPDRLALLEQAVTLLSPNDRLLLSLYYHDNRKLKEIALIMGCTDSYLRSRLQWIRKYLCHTIYTLERK